MAVSLRRRLASRTPAAVYPAVGVGARDAVRDLHLRGGVELVTSPRHATVLLVAGALPRGVVDTLAQVHDQLPPPRTTVYWGSGDAGELVQRIPGLTVVPAADDVIGPLLQAHRDVVTGGRDSEPDLLPPEPPVAWRGVGPHGQGGEGMMGGRPYGRPMAMTGEDLRDGLQLDRVAHTFGPFLTFLPPGLELDVELQGDVLQAVTARSVFSTGAEVGGPVVPPHDDPFLLAAREPVLVAELELARARHHLLWLAEALRLQGLEGLADRSQRLAWRVTPDDRGEIERLRRWTRRSGAAPAALTGVGVVDADDLTDPGWFGPTARATGLAVDARSDDPVYRGLGFAPVTQEDGDVAARWQQRFDEVLQSLDLATRSGHRTTGPTELLEHPRGTRGRDGDDGPTPALNLLERLLPGYEWSDAVTTIASLDLEMDPAPVPADRGR